ncbi:MAG: Wzt carbohydrate-binding domain-containing protein [Lachnospira sp.]
MVDYSGDVFSAVNHYISEQRESNVYDSIGSKDVEFEDFRITKDIINLGDDLEICFTLKVNQEYFSPLQVNVNIFNDSFEPITHTSNLDVGCDFGKPKSGTIMPIICRLKNVNIAPGKYSIVLYVGTNDNTFQEIRFCMNFTVEQGSSFIIRPFPYPQRFQTVLQTEWEVGSVLE